MKRLDDIEFGHVVIAEPQEAIVGEILALYVNFVSFGNHLYIIF